MAITWTLSGARRIYSPNFTLYFFRSISIVNAIGSRKRRCNIPVGTSQHSEIQALTFSRITHNNVSCGDVHSQSKELWQWKCERLKCQTLEEECIQLSVKEHPAIGLPFQRKYVLPGQGKQTGRYEVTTAVSMNQYYGHLPCDAL
jgi:hypothetical protein